MAYTPTEWQSGDIVTSAKLNKIEQGIADAGGGSELPDYSGANDGDVLAIASGAPAWTAPSGGGGGGVMVVNVTSEVTLEDQTVYSADKTYAEVAAAIEAGQDVVARLYSTSSEFTQLSLVDFSPIDKIVGWEIINVIVDEDSPNEVFLVKLRLVLQNDGVADTVELEQTEATVNTVNS